LYRYNTSVTFYGTIVTICMATPHLHGDAAMLNLLLRVVVYEPISRDGGGLHSC
jgi:hypothetical protein